MARLRIGVLGAARIAAEGIIEPARALGHEAVAVAARDRARAEQFAAEHSVAHVHDTYADVIDDAVSNAELMDECLRKAGLGPR